METQPTNRNVAETMRDVMKQLAEHTTVDLPETFDPERPFLITVPEGRRIEDLTSEIGHAAQFLRPLRRKGTAKLEHLQSLIDWSNRFKSPESMLYANPDMTAPSLTCIANYHAEGGETYAPGEGVPGAAHCDHRARYAFPLSDEWKAWKAIDGVALEKDDLGEFIEANAKDIMDPTPAMLRGVEDDKNDGWENRLIQTAQKIEGRFGQLTKLLALSKQFQVFESSDLKVSTNRDTGESEIQFLNEHKDADGRPLNIPNLIIIAIPVFAGGALYRMAVRFRYRKSGGQVKFILSIYNPERAFKASFEEACEDAKTATALPLMFGTPES